MRFFDSHCHLSWEIEGDPASARIQRARESAVEAMLCVAIDWASAQTSREIAQQHHGVLATVGVHPNDVTAAGPIHEIAARLEALCQQGGWAAIGETGLDFYRDHTAPAAQEEALEIHLDAADKHSLPVILHCREAGPRLLQVLQARRHPLTGVMHCYSLGSKELDGFLDLGLHISFAGNLSYPRSDALRSAAARVPEDRLLIETDSPFLAPQPMRGKRNEPAFVVHTAATLAEVRGCSRETIATLSWDNAVSLFGDPTL